MKIVSVCIATYNGEKFILAQLRSILKQLSRNDEIVISDDSSTDSTISIIKNIADYRIRILENNTFRNPIYNFENALKHAHGDLIFLSDQDDLWKDNKIEVMSNFLSTYDLVTSDCEIINEDGVMIHDSFFQYRKSGRGIIKNIYRNTYLGCCMAFRRSLLDYALPFPANIPMHDMWLGIIAELYGNTFFCPDKLVQYRRHATSATTTGNKSLFSLKDKIVFRINLISAISNKVFRRI